MQPSTAERATRDGRQTSARHAGGGSFTATGTLVRFMLRRDRIKLPAWVGGLGIFVVYISAALPQLAPEESDLSSAVVLFGQPVGRMLTGPAYGLDAPTYERFLAAGYGLYFGIIAALMSIMLVVRHTRLEEQTGRAELIRANVTGRNAALTATLIVAVITNLLAVVVIAGLAVVSGFDATGSVLFAVGVGAVGLAFAGISAVTVQLSEYSRAAAGMAGGLLGVAFLLRAAGDTPQVGGTALSWLSPLAWAQQTAPFVLDRWWPLGLALALFVVTAVAAYLLHGRRDLGASLFAVRRGRAAAKPRLGTPMGLAFRLQRGGLLGWGVALVLAGVVDGAFAQAVLDAADGLPDAMREMFGAEDMVNGYLAFIAVFVGYLAAAYGVFALQNLRGEEQRGRADAVLATPTSRRAWMGSHLLVIALGIVGIMTLSGVGAGLAAAAVTGDSALVWELTAAHLNLVPAPLVMLAVAALLYGFVPRLMAPIAWAFVGLMIFVGNFGSLLDLPEAVVDLSPLSHPAQMPMEPFAAAPVLILLAVAAAGTVLGLVGFRRRQLHG